MQPYFFDVNYELALLLSLFHRLPTYELLAKLVAAAAAGVVVIMDGSLVRWRASFPSGAAPQHLR